MKNIIIITLTMLIQTISHSSEDKAGVIWRATTTTIDGERTRSGASFKTSQVIKTGVSARAKAEINTVDNSRYLIYRNTSIVFDELVMDGKRCKMLKATLTKGKVKSTSGACGHGKTEIQTKVASAFAWGTDYELIFIPEGGELKGYEGIPAGFYQKVNEGSIMVSNLGGSILLEPGDASYVRDRFTEPKKIKTPSFFSNVVGKSDMNNFMGSKKGNLEYIDETSIFSNNKLTPSSEETYSGGVNEAKVKIKEAMDKITREGEGEIEDENPPAQPKVVEILLIEGDPITETVIEDGVKTTRITTITSAETLYDDGTKVLNERFTTTQELIEYPETKYLNLDTKKLVRDIGEPSREDMPPIYAIKNIGDTKDTIETTTTITNFTFNDVEETNESTSRRYVEKEVVLGVDGSRMETILRDEIVDISEKIVSEVVPRTEEGFRIISTKTTTTSDWINDGDIRVVTSTIEDNVNNEDDGSQVEGIKIIKQGSRVRDVYTQDSKKISTIAVTNQTIYPDEQENISIVEAPVETVVERSLDNVVDVKERFVLDKTLIQANGLDLLNGLALNFEKPAKVIGGLDAKFFHLDNGVLKVDKDVVGDIYDELFDPITKKMRTVSIDVDGDNIDFDISDGRSKYSTALIGEFDKSASINEVLQNKLVIEGGSGGLTEKDMITVGLDNDGNVSEIKSEPSNILRNQDAMTDSITINDGNSTIHWGLWKDYSNTGKDMFYLIEDNTNDIGINSIGGMEMKLPKEGVYNYNVLDKSSIYRTRQDAAGDWSASIDENLEVESADLKVNFNNNDVKTSIVVTDSTEPVVKRIVSEEVNAKLNSAGAFSGGSLSRTYGQLNESISKLSTQPNEGDMSVKGSMMGNSGSHAGMIYNLSLSPDEIDVANGSIVFELDNVE